MTSTSGPTDLAVTVGSETSFFDVPELKDLDLRSIVGRRRLLADADTDCQRVTVPPPTRPSDVGARYRAFGHRYTLLAAAFSRFRSSLVSPPAPAARLPLVDCVGAGRRAVPCAR